MAEDGLSIDIGAALSTAATPTETPAPEQVETPAQETTEQDHEVESSGFFSNVPDADDTPTEESSEGNPPASETASRFSFKGDGKDLELDPVKDRAEIERRLSMSEGAKRAFTRADKLQKRVKEMEAKLPDLEKKNEILSRMQKAYEDGGEEAAFQIFSGGKSLEDEIQRRVAEELTYQSASESEKTQIEREREERSRTEEREKEKRSLQREREEIQQERSESQLNRAHSMAYPAFKSVVASLDIKDSVERQGIAKLLWRSTWDSIADLGDVEFTPEIFEKEFETNSKLLGYSRKEAAKKEMKKVVEETKQVASQQASAAVSKNYKRGTKDLSGLSGLNPTQIHKKLFGAN